MDTQQISRLSRKDLQSLHHASIDNLADYNDTANTSAASHPHNIAISITNDSASDNNSNTATGIETDEEDDDFDDFSMHDLKNLHLSSNTFTKPFLKDPETQSNSSSSAASTVIHNPRAKSNGDNDEDDPEDFYQREQAKKIINSVSLHTLESDPELQNKLHRKLRLSNVNAPIQQSQLPQTIQQQQQQEEEEKQNDNEIDDILDGIECYQTEHNDDDEDEQHHEEGEDQDDNGSTNSLDSMEDITNDKLTDYIEGMLPSPPSSPPRELDPTKLYALYDFSGPDPSHLPLLKNESVLLLNDSDSYWWLVRKVDNNRIGFAPAEILETYTERLARLNCWKNEILERGGYKGLKMEEEKKLFCTDYPINHPLLEHESINESVVSITTDSNSVSNKIERKGSLKKPKVDFNYNLGSNSDVSSPPKKSVSFADINEVKESTDIEDSNGSIDEEGEDSDEGFDIIDENDDEYNNNTHNNNENDNETSYSLLDGYQNEYSIEDNIHEIKESKGIRRNSTEDGRDNDPNASTTKPLVVPKKRRNFMIKNLDDYRYSSEEVDTSQNKLDTSKSVASRSVSPEILTPTSSGNGNSLESTPTKMAMNNVTASTYSGSTDSLQRDVLVNEKKTERLNIPKVRSSERSASGSANETRLTSLKMLDELLETYPEFVESVDSGVESSSGSGSPAIEESICIDKVPETERVVIPPVTHRLGEGYRSNCLSDGLKLKNIAEPSNSSSTAEETETESDFSKSKNSLNMRSDSSIETDALHPKTMKIFDPLFSQMKQLDALLNEMNK